MPFKNIKDQVSANKRYRQKKKVELEEKDQLIGKLLAENKQLIIMLTDVIKNLELLLRNLEVEVNL